MDSRTLFISPLFHLVAKSGVHEIFTVTSLLVVLGAAFLWKSWVFPWRRIEPFKGLLLGLFFYFCWYVT